MHRTALHVKEFLQCFLLDILEVLVLVLTFRSVVHFELIIAYNCEVKVKVHFFFRVNIQLR